MGCFLGGMLARGGHEVTVLTREKDAAVLRADGIMVKTEAAGQFAVPVHATTDAAEVGIVELVLFCVKTYDTTIAARQIQSLVGDETIILTIQNGVDSAERIGEVVRAGHVVSGAAYFSATREGPGVVMKGGGLGGRLVIGDRLGTTSPWAERVARAFAGTEIEVQVHADIRTALWEKLLFIASMGAVCALTRLPIGLVVTCPETDSLLRGIMEEVIAVARASGANPATEAVERTLASLHQPSAAHGRPSQYHDLAAGRRLEISAFNGMVVRRGQRYGIPTPLNFALYAALKPFASGAPDEAALARPALTVSLAR